MDLVDLVEVVYDKNKKAFFRKSNGQVVPPLTIEPIGPPVHLSPCIEKGFPEKDLDNIARREDYVPRDANAFCYSPGGWGVAYVPVTSQQSIPMSPYMRTRSVQYYKIVQ